MFASKKQNVAIFAEGLKVVGSVTTDGSVKVYGEVDGEMRCASVVVSRQAHVAGNMIAEQVVFDGTMEGSIECDDIVLKANANVSGDIACESVMIEKGAFIEGRLMRRTNGRGLPHAQLLEGETGRTATGHAKALADHARPRARSADA
jgi:cytoskeletal protein CcmA (bactofilin family)